MRQGRERRSERRRRRRERREEETWMWIGSLLSLRVTLTWTLPGKEGIHYAAWRGSLPLHTSQ